jgi:hypothetical protein
MLLARSSTRWVRGAWHIVNADVRPVCGAAVVEPVSWWVQGEPWPESICGGCRNTDLSGLMVVPVPDPRRAARTLTEEVGLRVTLRVESRPRDERWWSNLWKRHER